MQRSAVLTVKGTKYYSASKMFESGALRPGEAILLRREPSNTYDMNAVEVILERGSAKIGHLSKIVAPKYTDMIKVGSVDNAKIKSVSRTGDAVSIEICVSYRVSDDAERARSQSLLVKSCSSLPASAGVYRIKNTRTSRFYIGSSKIIRSRVRDHVVALFGRTHYNSLLQEDFNKIGADFFEAAVIKECPNGTWHSSEAQAVESFLKSGNALYNMTDDGDGRKPWSGRKHGSSVSDRYAAYYRAEAIRKKQAEFQKTHIDPLIERIEPIEEALRVQRAGLVKSIFGETITYNMQYARYPRSEPHSCKFINSREVENLIDTHKQAIAKLKRLRTECDAIANTTD
jgi:group I intron endonuclease